MTAETCKHFGSEEPNPAAEERAIELRYGAELPLWADATPGSSGYRQHEVRVR